MSAAKLRRIAAVGAVVVASCAASVVGAPAAHATAGNRAFVWAIYADFLGNTPSAGEVSAWESQLDLGTLTRGQMIDQIFASADFQATYISQVFEYYMNRYTLDSESSAAQTDVGSGDYLSLEKLAIGANDYAWDDYAGSAATDTEFVTKLYNDVLWRAPDSGGLAYWTGVLGGGTTRSSVAGQIIRLSEAAGDRVGGVVTSPCTSTTLGSFTDIQSGAYCLILKRAADSGGLTYWTGQLSGSGQLPALYKSLASSSEYYTRAATRFPGV
ncbi:MAG TPA: DUF4214 domain-containing protein [Acidimicrobiales bacterium]|jgi:hypothetical protein